MDTETLIGLMVTGDRMASYFGGNRLNEQSRYHRRRLTSSGRGRGFTLIELMVTVAIVGILAAIAFPSYQNSMRKSRRVDAKTALLDMASREERFFSTNNTYSTTPTDLGYTGAWPTSIPSATQNNYAMTVSIGPSGSILDSFSVTAVPQGDQANDPCGTYTLDQTGKQTNSGTSATPCW